MKENNTIYFLTKGKTHAATWQLHKWKKAAHAVVRANYCYFLALITGRGGG